LTDDRGSYYVFLVSRKAAANSLTRSLLPTSLYLFYDPDGNLLSAVGAALRLYQPALRYVPVLWFSDPHFLADQKWIFGTVHPWDEGPPREAMVLRHAVS
jgi:hypothetical protein